MSTGRGWRIWIRDEPDWKWMEPVIAGPLANVGWDSEEDAEMIAQSVRDLASPTAEVRVLPEGQHPDDSV